MPVRQGFLKNQSLSPESAESSPDLKGAFSVLNISRDKPAEPRSENRQV